MRNYLRFLLILSVAVSVACNSAITQSSETAGIAPQNKQEQPQSIHNPFLEPISRFDNYPEDLRSTWRSFTSNGQYRLAQISDMRFLDKHKDGVPESPMPFVYIWGDLNYEKRVDNDHLAAIVVDKTKTDSNRFSLVIFSPPKGKKDIYEIHWLYRNDDLSRTTVNRASGSLSVRRYFDESSQSCFVEWNHRKKQFECK